MTRKQMNIRLDDLTRDTVKRIAERWNMSESQVITRGVVLLEQELKRDAKTSPNTNTTKQ
jgi:predicted transcriptional regulator